MPMPISISKGPLPGLLICEADIARDNRGYFSETYSQSVWKHRGFEETFVQDNLSMSAKGTLRGLHYQLNPNGQGKLVQVLRGSVYDVVVDIRRGSPTFGEHFGLELSSENRKYLWVPVGFAHGFIALEQSTHVLYKCTTTHAPSSERSILYNDPKLEIDWPLEATLISDKDKDAPIFEEAEFNFEYEK